MKSLLVELVALVGLLATAFFLGFRPTSVERDRARAQRRTLQADLSALQTTAADAATARTEARALRRLWEIRRAQERRRTDATLARRDLRAALAKAGAEIVRQGPVEPSDGRGDAVSDAASAASPSRIDEFVMVGSFLPILQVLEKLEAERLGLLRVVEFEATRGDRPVRTRCRLRTTTPEKPVVTSPRPPDDTSSDPSELDAASGVDGGSPR